MSFVSVVDVTRFAGEVLAKKRKLGEMKAITYLYAMDGRIKKAVITICKQD
jgi:hypothetical protein